MNRPTTRTLAILGALGATFALAHSTNAYAFKLTGFIWAPDDLPKQWWIGASDEPSVPEGYSETAVKNGYEAWKAASCADVPTEYMGRRDDDPGFQNDGINVHTFGDPHDDLAPGVLGLTQSIPTNRIVSTYEGQQLKALHDTDVVYSGTVQWTTDDAIKSGNCADQYSLQAVSTHETGHSLGLDHSCESNDPCTDPALQEATMFWSTPPCDAHQSTISSDDIEALTVLYGPYTTFKCSNEVNPDDPNTRAVGNVPFTLRCSLDTKYGDQITGVTWYWGDGAVSDNAGFDESHDYSTPGNFTVRACIQGTNDTCGDWDYCFKRESYVQACDVPAPSFDVQHVDGRTYQFMNNTDISVYGCVSNVEWDVFDSSGTQIDTIPAWEPQYTFDSDGDYHVVLNVGGPAGTGAADLTFTARNYRGEGRAACDTGTTPMSAAGLLLLLGLIGLGRRRE